MTTAATIPTDYSVKEAWQILRETAELVEKDARFARVANARAAAVKKPPTARELFFTHIGEALDRGLSKREAVTELAKVKPDLHAAFVQGEQRVRQDRLGREQQERSKARDRRNSR